MADLIRLGLDWETFYSKDYSLSHMMTPEYVLDQRFEPIILGLAVQGHLPVWYSGDFDYFHRLLGRLPWDRIEMIAHNAIFDASILEWKFGYRPARYMCTMMGSRPYIAPYTGSVSLASCLDYTNLGEKGDAVRAALGKRRADFSPSELRAYGEYCANDAVKTCHLDKWIAKQMPQDERDIIDATIKKFTRPKLKISVPTIEARLASIAVEKADVEVNLVSKGFDVATVKSREKFAVLLESQQVTVPLKVSVAKSKTAGKPMTTFAMSKQDEAFMALLDHDDEIVRDLVEARLFLASNMEETRLLRMATIAALNYGDDNLLPVPLLYYGAHPGRFSGLDSINLQNLPRHKFDAKGNLIKRSSLRDAIVAPDGYVIIAADLSNIEARLVATLSGQYDMVAGFAQGKDLYADFATRIYGRLINKKTDPEERFVGKTCILGLGYGMGAPKFYKQMVIAKAAGVEDLKAAKRIVYLYRDVYDQIPKLWGTLEAYMTRAIDPQCLINFGPVNFLHERIMLPNGMPIIYPGLRFSQSKQGLAFSGRKGRGNWEQNLWGGGITENICQALARIILTRAEMRLAKAGLSAVLQVHDELIYCVKKEHAELCIKAIDRAMTAQVDFLPRLPVAAEIHAGPSYGDAK